MLTRNQRRALESSGKPKSSHPIKASRSKTGKRAVLGDISNNRPTTTTTTDVVKKDPATFGSSQEDDPMVLDDNVYDFDNYGRVPLDNPQWVAEYRPDIFNYYYEIESKFLPPRDYLAKQPDLRSDMRRVLVDWLVEVHTLFELCPETLFLSIQILDRYLALEMIKRTKLQLVGSTALLIASKYEETSSPEIEDFVYVSDRAFTKDDVLDCESQICNALGFYLSTPTCWHFWQHFKQIAQLSQEMDYFSLYLMEVTLLDMSFLDYCPSMIACSAVYLAKYFENIPWDQDYTRMTRYSYQTMRPCVKRMYATVLTNRSSSVMKKYKSSKRLGVARIGIEAAEQHQRKQEEEEE